MGVCMGVCTLRKISVLFDLCTMFFLSNSNNTNFERYFSRIIRNWLIVEIKTHSESEKNQRKIWFCKSPLSSFHNKENIFQNKLALSQTWISPRIGPRLIL